MHRELLLLLSLLALQCVYKLGYDYLVGPDDQIQRVPLSLSPSPAQVAKDGGPLDMKLGFLGHYERPGAYAFRVGDIVVHRGHGQVGVIVERFDRCQLSEAWLKANALPGMTGEQPFYTILVSSDGERFTRHGAQSSHRRWDPELDGGQAPPVRHPDIKRYFKLFDVAAARYEPLDKEAAAQDIRRPEWDKGIVGPR
mmetsp:Transcript_39698/g.71284  ORF Transcript_39698/g.71284 Transcript_39698/m.71284 type:complete len:197 (-) Transcript_39698:239-829(-)